MARQCARCTPRAMLNPLQPSPPPEPEDDAHALTPSPGITGTSGGDGWGVDDSDDEQQGGADVAHGPAVAALVSKLQRLEAERRMAADENADLQAQLDMARAAVSKVATLTDAMAQVGEAAEGAVAADCAAAG
jgi:hypothetical protein